MNNYPESNPLHLVTDFCAALRRYWLAVVVVTAIFAAVAAGSALTSYKPMYESSAIVSVSSAKNSNENDAAAMLAATFDELTESKRFKNPILHALGTESLQGTAYMTQIEKTNLLTVSVHAADARTAYDELTVLLQQYPALARSVVGSELRFAVQQEPALAQKPNNSANWKYPAVMFGAVGCFLGLCVLFVFVITRTGIRRREEFAQCLDLPLLDALPHMTQEEQPSERIRSLRIRLARAMGQKKSLLVTSATAHESCEVVALELARSFARAEQRVVLVDIRPAGEDMPVFYQAQPMETMDSNVFVLKGGGTLEQASRAWGDPRTAQKLALLRKSFDRIVVCAPAYAAANDWSALTEGIDAALLVVAQNRTKRRLVCRMLRELKECGVPFVGGVLTEVQDGLRGFYQLEPRKRKK